jgi:hypothetical protein
MTLALLAMVAVFLLAPRSIVAQEPSPPESAAPQPDPQSQPDTQAADDDSPDSDTPADAMAPNAAQPRAAQPGAAVGAQPDAAAPAPDLPHWPINDKAGQATVTWDSKGLSIAATNSSLQQILKDISTATGVKVEGMNRDERVFGAYGPGQARDVLSELLLGAGYNVIMIGDQGQGAPRQILLSTRRSQKDQGAKSGAAANNDDDAADNDVDDQPQQTIQPPMRPAFPGGPPRNPQQMMQEREQMRLQRQQMIQNQNQQPQPQPNNPPN